MISCEDLLPTLFEKQFDVDGTTSQTSRLNRPGKADLVSIMLSPCGLHVAGLQQVCCGPLRPCNNAELSLHLSNPPHGLPLSDAGHGAHAQSPS